MNNFSNIIYKVKKFIVEFVSNNKTLISIVSIALICSIAIAIGVYAQVTNKKIINNESTLDDETYQQLKQNFNNLFNNEENEYISLEYDIEQEKQRKV